MRLNSLILSPSDACAQPTNATPQCLSTAEGDHSEYENFSTSDSQLKFAGFSQLIRMEKQQSILMSAGWR